MLTPLIHMHSITYSKVCGRVIGCNYNLLFGPITIIMLLYTCIYGWNEYQPVFQVECTISVTVGCHRLTTCSYTGIGG